MICMDIRTAVLFTDELLLIGLMTLMRRRKLLMLFKQIAIMRVMPNTVLWPSMHHLSVAV